MPGYVRQPISNRFWMSERDYETLQREGVVLIADTVGCDKGNLVMEVDQDTFRARPVAVTTTAELSQVLDTLREGHSRAFRPEDIVDLEEICKRTNRTKPVVVGQWKKKPGWPTPVMKLGNSEGFYWPDIEQFLRQNGMPLWRGDWEKPSRKEGDAA